MSTFKYCETGGLEGINTSTEELNLFSRKLNLEYLDEVIPLPEHSFDNQRMLLRIPHDCGQHMYYFERIDNGKHGWCCSFCGKVHQWG